MLNNAWLSILGLYKHDNTIFDGMVLPTAADLNLSEPYLQDVVQDLSRDVLTFKILADLAELPLVYPDPEMMALMITRWSQARLPVWRELWKTTLYRYNPIWNKDGSYTETRDLTTAGSNTGSVQDSSTGTGHLEREQLHYVTGYDTDSYAADTKDTTKEDSQTTGSLNRSTSGQASGTESETVTRTEQGNIGVTSTQSMIREQREIVLFDMYQLITEEFKKQFCIMVY